MLLGKQHGYIKINLSKLHSCFHLRMKVEVRKAANLQVNAQL